jgi:hypothetical protein
MAVLGLFTSEGISKTIDAANNEGFFIKPLEFGVSRNTGPLDPSRTGPNSGLWYQAPITQRDVVDANTIRVTGTIPQGAVALPDQIREVYLFGEDSNNNQFLLALGQPTEVIQYDPDGTVTIELQISLVDVDLTANYLFPNTFPTEIANHIADPNAHPEYTEAMAKAGIFIPAGGIPFDYVGQSFDTPVEFDGTKSTGSSTGTVINFTGRYNGTETNGAVLEFDGVKTVDEVVTLWNNANPNKLIDHDGVGTEVLTTQTVTLLGGTYVVEDKDIVYRDTDGIYKRAIADGTIRATAVALAQRDKRCIITKGLFTYPALTRGFNIGDTLFLSGSSFGRFDDLNNGIGLGICLGENLILFTGFSGSADANISQNFDAVVTNVNGLGLFTTTQDAINAVPDGGRILIDKVEQVKTQIDTLGKSLEFVTNGVSKGWTRFLGQVASFRLDFGGFAPDNGTFRIEWNGQESADLPFNATALDLQNEFNLFAGHTGVTVTGDFVNGFVFTFLDEVAQPLPTFLDPGLNEIQRFNFGNVPDDGTITFEYEGEATLNFPWDDLASDLKIALEALTEITNVNVTGEFATNFFQIEFTGGVLQDGLQPKNEITVIAKDLMLGAVDTTVNGSNTTPINPITVQQGKFPASNLRIGVNPVTITVTQNTIGEPLGPTTAFLNNSANTRFRGLGYFENFDVAIDNNGQDGLVAELRFLNTALPIKYADELPGLNYDNDEILGYAKDIFAQLKITEHPSNKKRVKISTSDVNLASGVELVQELNSLLLSFEGAEIDFTTGETFYSDGVTPLGIDFTPVIPASQQFRWASITIVPKQTTADQKLEGQVLVLFGDSDGATRESANKAPFGTGKPLGQVVLEGDLGLQEITRIIATRDEFSSLDGKYFVLYDDVGSVAFWIDVDDSGTTIPAGASGANRAIEITTIVENDDPNAVASKIQAVIDADSKFSAVVSDNRITVTDATIGPRSDAEEQDSTFTIDVLQQGRDTDATGLVDISNTAIKQLGVGSGSGGGTGGGPSFLQDLKFQLKDGPYEFLVASVFGQDQDAKVDNSTGAYSFPDSAWALATGEVLETINLVDGDYYALLQDIISVDFVIKYVTTDIDANPIVEISVDGGQNYETVSLDRIGDTDTFVSSIEFDDSGYTLASLYEYALSNKDDLIVLNQSTQARVSQEFDTGLNPVEIARSIDVIINKLGAPTGFYGLRIVKDNGGDPSTDINDKVFESSLRNIELLSVGDNTESFEIPRAVLEPSTKYHIEVFTDDTYKSGGYQGSTDEIAVGSDSSTPSIADAKIFNGTSYSSVAGFAVTYLITGRVLDLRVRITASQDALLDGFGIFYGLEDRVQPDSKYPVEYIYLQGDNDPTLIPISQFNVNPDTLLLLDLDTGQCWSYGAFSFSGNNLSVPSGSFDRAGETIRLKALLVGGGTFSNDDNINSQLAENHLWSGNSNQDKSVAGRGVTLKSGANVNTEIAINEFGQITLTPRL